MTKRKRLTSADRARIFEKHGGICHLCNMKIVAGEDWEASHDQEHWMGGACDDENLKPAHYKCHRVHTAEHSIPLIAKTKRMMNKHSGAKLESRNPLPGGRKSKWKRTIDGRVVPR